MRRLGDLERAVMEILWQRGEPLAIREVTGVLSEGREIAPTTVMTVLDRLAKKGLAHRWREGRAWRYCPAASREAYIAEIMQDALDLTGDRGAALSHFARSVSAEEAQALRRALDEQDGGGR